MNFVAITDTVINPDKKETIDKMSKLTKSSFRANLKGTWEFLVLDSDFSSYFEENDGSYSEGKYLADNLHFFDAFDRIYNVWKEGNNILFISPDQLCVKPCKLFGEFKHFAMFWPTIAEDRYGFKPYLNSGITYFPKEMNESTWKLGYNLWKDNDQTWDISQVIYNHMFYSQDINVKDFLRNDLHWSPWTNNKIDKSEASIIHYHATKGIEDVYRQMQEDWK